MRSRTLLHACLTTTLLGCGPGPAANGNEDAGATTDMSGTGESAESDESSESSETGDAHPMDCGGVIIQPTYTPLELMFVVDRSPSMARAWDHDGDPNTPPETRWASVRGFFDELASVLGADVPVGATVGLQQFPSADACPNATPEDPTCADASTCTIADAPELALTEEGMSLLVASLPPATAASEFRGASPAAAAYASAVAQLLAGNPETLHYIVLITDGHLDCGSSDVPPGNLGVADPELLDLVEAAYEEPYISTIVVAVDEDAALDLGPDTIFDFDPRPSLEALALAGGSASYLSLADPNILDYFEPPGTDIVTCALDLTQTPDGPPTPEQIPLVTWTIDGVPIPYVEPDTCNEVETGWTWIVEGELMSFCGAACEALKGNGSPLIEGDYGCPDPI